MKEKKNHPPLKSTEHGRRPCCCTHMSATDVQIPKKDGQRDKAGEPEHAGDGIDGEDGVFVGGARAVGGAQAEVDDG